MEQRRYRETTRLADQPQEQEIHVILDNYSTHKRMPVKHSMQATAKSLRFSHTAYIL